jgi:hypothetical protein
MPLASELELKVSEALKAGKQNLPLFVEYLRALLVENGYQRETISKDATEEERAAEEKKMNSLKATLTGILLSSIANFHNNDYSVCLSLVPERVLELKYLKPIIDALLLLQSALERGEFTEFWNQWAKTLKLNPSVPPHFEATVRLTIYEVIANSVVAIKQETLARLLNVTDIKAFVTANSKAVQATLNGSADVAFMPNEFNTPKKNDAVEGITAEKIAALVRND